MNRIYFSQLANADLDAVWNYIAIEQHSPAAARRQLEQILKRSIFWRPVL